MSDKKDAPDRFTEPPKVLIGEEVVHDPYADKQNGKLEKMIEEGRRRATKDFIDELRRRWSH